LEEREDEMMGFNQSWRAGLG